METSTFSHFESPACPPKLCGNANGVYACSPKQRLIELQEEFVIIGGGPVGLAMAIGLKLCGESVRILERGSCEEASFNFTLVPHSLEFLEALGVRVQNSCAPIFGREIWRQDGRHSFHQYGLRKSDCLYSVPRKELLAIQKAVLASLGVEISEGWNVAKLNGDGTALVETPDGPVTISARRFVGADGSNSRVRDDIARLADIKAERQPDGFIYAVTHIAAPDAERDGLRSDRIHFSPGPDGVDIGIGNADGSISLLLERRAPGASMDQNSVLQAFMDGPPAVLRRLVRNLPEQIIASPKRSFKYASCGAYSHGNTVLVGDAARCWPPYLGQGLNAGLRDAASFLEMWTHSGRNWQGSLQAYGIDRKTHAERLTRLAHHHGKMLLTGTFGSRGWRLNDRVARLTERLTGHRSFYQQLVFDIGTPSIVRRPWSIKPQ